MPAVLTPDDYQSADDPAVRLADARERRIKASVLAALLALADAFGSQAVLDLIARNDIYGLLQILRHPDIVAGVSASWGPIGDLKLDAAKEAANENFGGLIVYDPLQASAPLMAQRQQYIDAIIGQSRQVMQQSILSGLRYGMSPEAVQLALENVIALTPSQANAVANFRRLLEQGNPQALNRVLRDRRFDATVQSWIDAESEPEADAIDAMVERYAERQLAFRAQTIARTEAMKAATGGIRDAYVQAVQSGRLFDHEVRRHWLVHLDERLCFICASVPAMNPDGVGVMQPYLSIAGPLMTVGPHARCRCSERYTADLSRLSVQPFAQAA